MNDKYTLAQARQAAEYQAQQIHEIMVKIEQQGYDIRLLQMQVRGLLNERREKDANNNNH